MGPVRTVAWRVLDAQYFGLAQRRKRVFVVASARKGFDPAEVLFEREGVRRDSPPSREAFSLASALTARGVGTCGADDNQAQANHLIVGHRQLAFGEYACDETASTMKARDYKDATDLVVHCMATKQIAMSCELELAPTLGANDYKEPHAVSTPAVRRLTPIECERLQGFPDNYTNVPYRGKPAPDGQRYKAIGNSKAIPPVRWLGLRIKYQLEKLEATTNEH
ncbi:DNA cytosine methyltransferase [Vibrio cholerae]|nr:DNA cytosine methyltransferase [Vibrio cholerae]MDV2400287.1 DNA cytosine methyltransferase [Vibrio cholerae]